MYQKLRANNEESLSGLLISGKRNPVAILGALNRRHGWNMGQPRTADTSNRALTAAELPKLAPVEASPTTTYSGAVIDIEPKNNI